MNMLQQIKIEVKEIKTKPLQKESGDVVERSFRQLTDEKGDDEPSRFKLFALKLPCCGEGATF